MLASASGSRVIDVSERLPDRDHLHLFGAADLGRDSRESGSGVLARLTLTGKKAGVSPLQIPKIDFDGNGSYELGPRLIVAEGVFIGDDDDDDFFDGTVRNAQVAVDSECGAQPPSTDPPGDDDPANTPADSDGGGGSSGDETVSLLPSIPPEISDSAALGEVYGPDGGTTIGSDGAGGDDSGGDASSDEDGSSGDSDGNRAARDDGSSSGLDLPLWVVLATTSAMLAFGAFIVGFALLARWRGY
jgi:hypothetical protein